MIAYLLLPLLGYALRPTSGRLGPRQLAEIVLLGPLGVFLLLGTFSLVGLPHHPALLLATGVALALGSVWLRRRCRRAVCSVDQDQHEVRDIAPFTAGGWWTLCALLLLAAWLAWLGLARPLFVSDPVTIYAPPAVLYQVAGRLDPELLLGVLEQEHLDYPPLYTANLTWLFEWAGGYDGFLPKPLGVLFFLGFVLELWNLATSLGSSRAALLWVPVFAFLPIVLKEATSGFADLALVAYLTAGLGSLVLLLQRERATARDGLRAGLFLGAAALTKNEGAAVAVLALLLAVLCAPRPRPAKALALAAGLLVLLAGPWALRVRQVGLENDLVQGLRAFSFGELGERLGMVLEALGQEMFHTLAGEEFAGAVALARLQYGLLFVLFAVALVLALRQPSGGARRALSVWLAPSQFALYILVFAYTHQDLVWHLDTASSRVLLQTVPAQFLLVLHVSGRR